jgi:flagellar hook-associated protein 1 FlgK
LANGEITVTIPKGSVLPDNTTLDVVQPDGTKQSTTFTGNARTLDAGDLTVKVKGLNQLHKLGYTLQNPLETGGDFFTIKAGATGMTADSIQVNPVITGNPDKIASSLRTVTANNVESVVKGNNTLAVLMSRMQDTKFSFGSSGGAVISEGTIDDFFRSTVGQLGVQANEASRQTNNQKVLVDQIDGRRQSVSGVSLDEEMANMIKFQHAYAAAARVMTTFDEMLDKIINGMGTVGR